MPFQGRQLVCNMSSSSTHVTAKTLERKFFDLGTRVALLRDFQFKLRHAGKNSSDVTRDLKLIRFETDLSYGNTTYKKGLSEYLKYTDVILEEAVARVEELKKLVDK